MVAATFSIFVVSLRHMQQYCMLKFCGLGGDRNTILLEMIRDRESRWLIQ